MMGFNADLSRCRQRFDSKLMDPILDAFEQVAAGLTFKDPSVAIVSTLTGRVATYGELSLASYWRKHVRDAVQFLAGMKTLAAEGARAFVEIGSNPILLGMGRQCIDDKSDQFAWLASLRRDRPNRAQLLTSLGELYVRGVDREVARTPCGPGPSSRATPDVPVSGARAIGIARTRLKWPRRYAIGNHR